MRTRVLGWIDKHERGFWPALGAGLVVVAILLSIIPAAELHGSRKGDIFVATDGFASLAGFTFLAAALERLAQFLLAPWWATVSTGPLQDAGQSAAGTADSSSAGGGAPTTPARVGVTGAVRLSSQARAVADAAPADPTKQAAAATADSVYVTATKVRPTIMLPMAAGAIVVCSFLHLYLLHSLAKSGLSKSEWSYVLDAVLTGFALAGGAQPFHDLVTSLASSASKSSAT